MQLQLLDKNQIISIYNNHLIHDFTLDEQKPLDKILELYSKQDYFGYGLFENSNLYAYLLFVKGQQSVLLDYFAVIRNNRGKGLGSLCLTQIRELDPSPLPMILEVEDPEWEISDAESIHKGSNINSNNDHTANDSSDIKRQRIHFYKKNGILSTSIKTMLIDTRMNIMYTSHDGSTLSEEFIRDELQIIYDKLFSNGKDGYIL